jgi:O-acetylhomoserine/O-acetylserine sulfhydrylase-like pyridoxal-dependent enzyme
VGAIATASGQAALHLAIVTLLGAGLDAWRGAIRPETRLLFGETLGNPGLKMDGARCHARTLRKGRVLGASVAPQYIDRCSATQAYGEPRGRSISKPQRLFHRP